MFQPKKQKMLHYLQGKGENDWTAFDHLLHDSLTGQMKKRLESIGVSHLETHIDWRNDDQCIGLQGKYGICYLDIQIGQDTISLSFAEDEPDEPESIAVNSGEDFYLLLKQYLKNRKGA